MKEEVLTLRNRLGLHARAAAKFVHTASAFEPKTTITKDGDEVNGNRILGLLPLAAGKGAPLGVRASRARTSRRSLPCATSWSGSSTRPSKRPLQ